VSPLFAGMIALAVAAPPDTAATHQVVAAVTEAAQANARAARPLGGDALTELYVRAAAAAARKLPEGQQAGAFLAALGIALDDSTILRNNPLFGLYCRSVETREEFKARLAVLGKPTVRGQRDKCQHFVVSCTLTALAGADAAEAAGMLKEQLDMRPGGSGFSFADLLADYAGVSFAVRVLDGKVKPDALARFAVTDFVPDFAGLDDGLTEAQFAKKFGSFADERFKAEVERVRKRVRELP
jgi:uncharacterized protein YfiM (DUF2279 family)